jgi:pyridoxine 5-phosphate synthase
MKIGNIYMYHKLGVNIDHIATIRNARNGIHPNPADSLEILKNAGADIVTIHLREDRRHIKDDDAKLIRSLDILPMNFEMAPTDEMKEIALALNPYSICIVPEKREELTTEGGFDLLNNKLDKFIKEFKEKNILVSVFIEADLKQIQLAKNQNIDMVELHSGAYAEKIIRNEDVTDEILKIKQAIDFANNLGLKCNLGHGLTIENITPFLTMKQIHEFHIGHYIIGESIFYGLSQTIKKFVTLLR